MEVIDVSALDWFEVAWDEARGSQAASIAFGSGEAHVRALRIDPGGEVGLHETGSAQLFVPIQGRAWVRERGREEVLEVGQAAYFPRGVLHAKGNDVGVVALVVQVRDLIVGGDV